MGQYLLRRATNPLTLLPLREAILRLSQRKPSEREPFGRNFLHLRKAYPTDRGYPSEDRLPEPYLRPSLPPPLRHPSLILSGFYGYTAVPDRHLRSFDFHVPHRKPQNNEKQPINRIINAITGPIIISCLTSPTGCLTSVLTSQHSIQYPETIPCIPDYSIP